MKTSIRFKPIIIEAALLMIFACPIWLRILYSVGIPLPEEISQITRTMMLVIDISFTAIHVFLYAKGRRKIGNRHFWYFLVIIILFIFASIFNNGYNSQIFSNFMGRVMPFLLVYSYSDNDAFFYKAFKLASYVVCVGVILFPFTKAYTMSSTPLDWQWNYMSLGYNTIVCWACILFASRRYRRVFDMLISYMSMVIYAVYSTRVMILCLFITLSLAIMFYDKSSKKRRYVLLIMTIGTIVFLFGYRIASYLALYFERKGINSRTLSLILQGKISSSQGRDIIYAKLLPYIKKELWIPHGFGFDRKICGNYAHNIFVELLLIFGLGLFVFLLLFLAFETYKILKSGEEDIIAIFLSICVPQFVFLQMSGTVCSELFLYVILFSYEKMKQSHKKIRRLIE